MHVCMILDLLVHCIFYKLDISYRVLMIQKVYIQVLLETGLNPKFFVQYSWASFS